MNKMRLAAALGISFLALGSAGFVACGGDDSNGGNPPPDGGNPDGNRPDSGTTDSGTKDTGTLEAAPPDKGFVTCNGSSTCGVPTNECCATDAGEKCQVANDPCPGIEAQCDEKADCPTTGDVCCATLGTNQLTLGCKATCPKEFLKQYQICKTDDECLDKSLKCVTQNCQGRAVSTCGGIEVGCQ